MTTHCEGSDGRKCTDQIRKCIILKTDSMMSPSVALSLSLLVLVIRRVGAVSVEVEDVTAKQFRAALQTEDIRIAVFWCK